MNIKEFANEYEPQKMGNITELEVVRTDIEIKSEDRVDSNNESYHVMFVVVDEKEYRVPPSVVGQLKEVLKAKPNLATFKVTKTGEGKNTKYQVISL